MSTRSTTHFIDSRWIDQNTGKPYVDAIVYRHSDGYPEAAGRDLFTFLLRSQSLADSRLTDASYLAARYVVFLSQKFASADDPLDFTSVGILMQDPGDIAYRYTVDCGTLTAEGLPVVKCFDMQGKEHDIPR